MTGMTTLVSAVVDAHCHIDLYPNPDAVKAEIEQRKVHTIAVTNAPSVFHFTAGLAKASTYLHAAVGLHPELVGTHDRELPQLLALIEQTRFVGEVGLDYVTSDKANRKRQVDAFEAILQRCANLGNKVLTVHSRRSSADVIALIAKTKPGTVILHWFSGPKRDLQEAVGIGCWFSVNPAMIISQTGRSLILAMPRDRVLTESDGPFVDVNGSPATPWDTAMVLQHLATVWQCTATESAMIVRDNFGRLLGPHL
jgi:TatD DNase family protein